MWIKSCEKLHLLFSKDILVEVEHVKAHHTKKEKKEMSHFERFVTDGNEKADELAKTGAMLDEGFMAEARAEMQPVFTVWWKNGRTVKSSSRNQKKSGFSWTRKGKK